MKTIIRSAHRHRGLVAGIALLQIAALSIATGCGGGSGGNGTTESPGPTPTPAASPNAQPTLVLSADQQELLRGQSTTLQWNTPNATTVVESNFGATTISGTLAVQPTQTTTYSLTVRNASGQTVVASVTVQVAEVAVAVTPGSAAVDISRQLTFGAQVSGAVDTGVSWAVQEAEGGTITPDGVYTAPNTSGIYHVRAVSHSDTSKDAVGEVNVHAAAGNITVH